MAAITNLSEYYKSIGKPLPPVSERAKRFAQLGLGSQSGYTGTVKQNEALLKALMGASPPQKKLPVFGALPPNPKQPEAADTKPLDILKNAWDWIKKQFSSKNICLPFTCCPLSHPMPSPDVQSDESSLPAPKEAAKIGLSVNAYEMAADQLGVEYCSIVAVANVESRGSGFLPSGHPVVRFESHIFKKYSHGKFDATHPELSHPYYSDYSAKILHKQYNKGGQREVDERLNVAIGLDREAALLATSWGRFQIMGFNFESAGYKSVEEFVAAMKASEDNQLLAFANFIKSNPAVHSALREKNWASFAEGYNGKEYRKNEYDTKMKDAYQACKSKSSRT